MANKRDYYEVLGLERSASPEAIKKAYRQLAMKYHPDRHPEDREEAEERFKEASEAYEVLSDPEKRARYDKYGHEGVKFSGGGFSGSDFHHARDFEDIFGMGDFFSSIFGDLLGGGGGHGPGRGRGRDIRIRMRVTLEEAFKGGERTISYKRRVSCGTCKGSRCAPGKSPVPCKRCHGRGMLQVSRGFFAFSTTCDVCGGTGARIEHPCEDCKGTGLVEEQRELTLTIPRGVSTDETYRLSEGGEGAPGGGRFGDLYIVFEVAEHELFGREGPHLYLEWPITFPQAALGDEIEVPTLDGPARLKIPAGSQSHRVFLMRGKGMPTEGHGRGDLFVRVVVDVPTHLNARQKELLRELAGEFKPQEIQSVRAKGAGDRGFFQRLADAVRGTFGG